VSAAAPDFVRAASFGFFPQGNIFDGDGIFQPPLLQPVVATEVMTTTSIA
jgi:hypothetical protein